MGCKAECDVCTFVHLILFTGSDTTLDCKTGYDVSTPNNSSPEVTLCSVS